MNNGKKRNGNELESPTKEPECTCGLCHKYKAEGSITLAHEFRKEVELFGNCGFVVPPWTCNDSLLMELMSGGYGRKRK